MRAEIRRRFIEGLQYVRSHQLLTGDIPCFRAAPDRFYCPCPLFSTLVHDALGYFDPHSPIYQPGILDSVSAAECRWIMGCATTVRWRIRSFIAWQEEPDGTWQFFGRESTSGADAATTACAAAVLLRAPKARDRAVNRHAEPVLSGRLLSGNGLTILERAQLLRFLALIGQ